MTADLQAEAEVDASILYASLPLVNTTFQCPKCAFGHIACRYEVKLLGYRWRFNGFDHWQPVDTFKAQRGVLTRTCGQCAHTWMERPMDSEEL